MLQVLSPEEVRQTHDKMLKWVEETLEGDTSTYLYNFLLTLQQLIDHIERTKMDEDLFQKAWRRGFEAGRKVEQDNKK